MVRGGDGKDYGPVSLNQLSVWAREGRLTQRQEIKRSDMEHWAPAKDFEELQPLFGLSAPATTAAAAPPSTSATPTAGAVPQSAPELHAQVKSNASWFYLVAGLSLVNSIMTFIGSSFRFALGLGVRHLIADFASGMGDSGPTIALILNILAAAILILLGLFSGKGYAWAFLTGIVLLALDAIPPLMAQRWIPAVAHAIVLYFLFRGFTACRKLKAAQAGRL